MTAKNLANWAEEVKERDGKCLHCGTDQDLHAHHKKPKSTHPELALDPDNGMTLCYRCHKAEHERMRAVRVRGEHKPRRKTLERKIAKLESTVSALQSRVGDLAKKLAHSEREVIAALSAPKDRWVVGVTPRPRTEFDIIVDNTVDLFKNFSRP